MGHLSNATGFRLGWTLDWGNICYIPLTLGYSSFIFACSRLRAFLKFFFYHKRLDQSSFIFNNFDIIKELKFLNIHISFYWRIFAHILNNIYKRTWREVRNCRRRWYRSQKAKITKLFRTDSVYDWWKEQTFIRRASPLGAVANKNKIKLFGKYLTHRLWINSVHYMRLLKYRYFKQASKFWRKARLDVNKFNKVNRSNKFNKVNRFNKFNKFNKFNRSIKFNKVNKSNKFNRFNKSNKVNRSNKFNNSPRAPNLYEWLKLQFYKRRKHMALCANTLGTFKLLKLLHIEFEAFEKSVKHLRNNSVRKKFQFLVASGCFKIIKLFKNKHLLLNNFIRSKHVPKLITTTFVSSLWLNNFKVGRNRVLNDNYFSKQLIIKLGAFKKHYSVFVLRKLCKLLNKREVLLDRFIPYNKQISVKFSYKDVNFWDALVEKLYDKLYLSRDQRTFRKAIITIEELILAVVMGLNCQSRYFKLLRFKGRARWRKNLPFKIQKFLSYLYYTSFKDTKYTASNFCQLFDKWFVKDKFVLNNVLYGGIKQHVGTRKAELLKLFKDKYPGFLFYVHPKHRLFSTAVLVMLAVSGYKKTTFYDLSYFRILYRALFTKNIFLLRKFFFLRWRANGCTLLRSNMRMYFFFSSFITPIKKHKLLTADLNSDERDTVLLSKRITGLLKEIIFRRCLHPISELLKYRFGGYLRLLFPGMVHNLFFFVLGNENIDSNFIARYIAKKLGYHHRLKSILNPVKTEFKMLGKLTNEDVKDYSISNKIFETQKLKVIWKFLLLIILLYYEMQIAKIFSINKINISFELFFNLMWLYEHYFWREHRIKEYKALYIINRMFLRRRTLIDFTRTRHVKELAIFSRPIYDLKNLGKFHLSIPSLLFNPLINDLFISKYVVICQNDQFISKNNSQYLAFGIFQYKRFLTLNYHAMSYAAYTYFNKLNFSKIRKATIKSRTHGFIGFKIKCVGRFSRRQRASSYWFSLGTVPLNSVDAHILYGAHTVVLVNSIVNIKVWINIGVRRPLSQALYYF